MSALVSGLRVLEQLAFATEPKGVVDIARAAGLDRGMTHRLLATLLFSLGAFPVQAGQPDTRALRHARDLARFFWKHKYLFTRPRLQPAAEQLDSESAFVARG